MTRINVVPPAELCGKHLVAEYRELPRVFALVRAAIARQERPLHVDRYTLGKGHVRFFYTRLAWLAGRQAALIAEMVRRGYNPQWCGDWIPDADAMRANRERIAARMPKGRV